MWPLVRRLLAAERWASRARMREGYDGQVPPLVVLHVACVEGCPDGVLAEALSRAGLCSHLYDGARRHVDRFRQKDSLKQLTDGDLRMTRRARVRLMQRHQR